MELKAWIQQSTEQLKKTSTTPELDAEVLLMHVLQRPRAFLYAYSNKLLSSTELKTLGVYLEQRLAGWPLAYILGEKEFWSMVFKVSPDVLIPRPETEHLVEIALKLLEPSILQKILELGTGSGAVAVALTKEHPHWEIFASDNSTAALTLAKENASRLLKGHHNLHFFESRWFEDIPRQEFSAIISNPPYIAEGDPNLEKLTYEPIQALTSGQDGLKDIQEIIAQSPHFLSSGGYLILEHGNTQAPAVTSLLQSHHFTEITTYLDLADHPRITSGRYKLR